MKIFIASLTVQRTIMVKHRMSLESVDRPTIGFHRSKSIAYESFMNQILTTHPIENGWERHSVNIAEVTNYVRKELGL